MNYNFEHVEVHHNPNEGREIINENFDKIEQISSSGTTYANNLYVSSDVSASTINVTNAIYVNGVNIAKSYITLPVGITDSSFAPIDETNYYFGTFGKITTTDASRRIYIWKNCIIKQASIWSYATTIGSKEDIVMYIRRNNDTDEEIGKVGISEAERNWVNEKLEIPFKPGEFLEIKMSCPHWEVNPIFDSLGGYLLLETFS